MKRKIECVAPLEIQKERTRPKYSCDPVADPLVYVKKRKPSQTPSICSEMNIPAFISRQNFVPPRFTLAKPSPLAKFNQKDSLEITKIPDKPKKGRPRKKNKSNFFSHKDN